MWDEDVENLLSPMSHLQDENTFILLFSCSFVFIFIIFLLYLFNLRVYEVIQEWPAKMELLDRK